MGGGLKEEMRDMIVNAIKACAAEGDFDPSTKSVVATFDVLQQEQEKRITRSKSEDELMRCPNVKELCTMLMNMLRHIHLAPRR